LLSDAQRTAGIEADLIVSGVESDTVATVQDLLCAVVREALANVAKHSHARTVLVTIQHHEDRVEVVIQDDGVGASALVLRRFEESYLHFGLRNMRRQILERAGTFEVANGEEGGLTVRVSVPLVARSA
jgi:signal transduction histidine kinase